MRDWVSFFFFIGKHTDTTTFFSFSNYILFLARLQVVGLLDRRTSNEALVPGPVVGVVLGGIKLLELISEVAVYGELPGHEAEVDIGAIRRNG